MMVFGLALQISQMLPSGEYESNLKRLRKPPDAIDAPDASPCPAMVFSAVQQLATSRRVRRDQKEVIPHQPEKLARAAKVGHGAPLRVTDGGSHHRTPIASPGAARSRLGHLSQRPVPVPPTTLLLPVPPPSPPSKLH